MSARPSQRRAADSSLRRARSRLAALVQLDNIGPALIIAIAVVISLEPKPFGIEISDRHVILALFALLGATAPVFPDHEHGIVEGFYSGEQLIQLAYVREKLERSHPGFAHHKHSFIKQIVRLRDRTQR